MAKPRIIDFSTEERTVTQGHAIHKPAMNKKQIRARIRKTGKITKEEFETLYKPIDEWDAEELARGRPRNREGNFKGKNPAWISREMHEEIVRRFTEIVKTGMQAHTVTALQVIGQLLESGEVDMKGRPLVSPSTKGDLAKFLLEHVVGKPTVRQEVDISVRLQALLATSTSGMAFGGADVLQQGSAAAQDYADAFGLPAGVVDAEAWEDEDSDLDQSYG